jgi:hypothetical protein
LKGKEEKEGGGGKGEALKYFRNSQNCKFCKFFCGVVYHTSH